MTHTLYDTVDNLVTGLIYKFKFRAINAIGNSQDSAIVQFALADMALPPGAPTLMMSLSSQT